MKHAWITVTALVIISLIGQFGPWDTGHAPHLWESVPLFGGIFAMLGTAVIIVLAKNVLDKRLRKPEDYYDRH
jgi:hypothetical protein